MLRTAASLLIIAAGIAGVMLTAVPVDMEDTTVDNYRFIFYKDLDRNFPAFEEVTNRTVGFVYTPRIREWYPGMTRKIHLEDGHPVLSIYETCWHEVRHWELGVKKQLTEKQEHRVIHNTPFWEKTSMVCTRLMVKGFSGLQL